MKTMKTAAALLLSVLISIISVSSGFPQSPPPPGSATVEGTWVITYQPPYVIDGGLGKKFTIRLKGPGEYEVISYTGKPSTYFGSSTEIQYLEKLTFDDAKRRFRETPESAIREALGAGLLNTTFSFKLSPDRHTMKILQTTTILRHYVQSGRLESHQVLAPKEDAAIILTRISGPAPAPKAAAAPAPQPAAAPAAAKKTATSPFAQVESRGEFHVLTKDGKKLTGAEANKIPLEEGTKVVTGKSGHVRMTLPDNTTFTVGANTDFVIDKFVYDPDQSPKKVMVGMTKGVFRWVTGKTAAARKELAELKIDLPPLVGGIRGTDFEAVVEPKGRGRVALYSGELEITEKKSEYTFILKAGQMVTFGPDGKVSRPKKIKGAQMLEDEEED